MTEEHSQFEGAFEKWAEYVDNLAKAVNAFLESIAEFAKRFCNAMTWVALVTTKPEAKHLLKSNIYQPDLRRKTALKALGLRFANHS